MPIITRILVTLVGLAAGMATAANAATTADAVTAVTNQPAADKPVAEHPAIDRRPGWSDKSYYLPMRDGVRVAVSLYFKDHQPPATATATILVQTRYGRATQVVPGRYQKDTERWLAAGYVVAVVDTRGSTASFGPREGEIVPEEVLDMDAIIAHLAAQPWSNGQVIAAGGSYMADTADWATSRPTNALIGAIPRETDFDIYLDLFAPGGVLNEFMVQAWGARTHEMDLGRSGAPNGPDCVARLEDCAKLFPILQPVDEDPQYALLREALSGRKRWTAADYEDVQFRDDRSRLGNSLFESSPAAALRDLQAQHKPTQYWGSWLDAGTAHAALARYASLPHVPMEVWITANDHPQRVNTDPLRPQTKEPIPSPEEQFATQQSFVERLRQGRPIERVIHYSVLGTERFETTPVWPPRDARRLTLHFASEHRLAARGVAAGVDRYEVDFSATTGQATRWSTQLGRPAAYQDRRAEDEKLLHYDAPPLDVDTEIVGTPVVTLDVATATSDPAFFVYLEDVAPDGRVTYLTEGEFRAVHRKLIRSARLPYDEGPVPHSFNRADAQPMVPGVAATVRFALFPTAALLSKGHHIRLCIAGADAGIFHRYSQGQSETFSVSYGRSSASALELTTRPSQP